MRERSISSVPKWAVLLLVFGMALQIGWCSLRPAQQAKAEYVEAPPSLSTLRILSVGEPIALAKLLMFYLQAFDQQAGISVPVQTLDYVLVTQWLGRVSDLDPLAQYPLTVASQLYAEVPDGTKKRQMLEFVYQRFLENPNHRWKSLAHVTLIAKYQLKDLPLALRYAKALRLQATDKNVPDWVRQLEIFVLEDMDELESAKILIGGFLQSGQISDPRELHFLSTRLKELEARTTAK
ncbi:MAG: hypothetical protein V4805_12275 [Pseudomonadota bacterium]